MSIAAPLGGAVLFIIEVVEVVHVGIGLHFEGVETIACILQTTPIAAGEEPVPAVENVEAEPRIVGGACLIEVNHLVILDGAADGVLRRRIDACCFFLAVRDDTTKEGHTVVAFTDEPGTRYGTHVGEFTRSSEQWHIAL